MSNPESTTASACLQRVGEWSSCRGLPLEEVEPLPGDLSTRQYFRCRWEHRSVIVAAYPTDALEAAHRFVTTTQLLEGASVPVPTVLDFDPSWGMMMLSDAGAENLYQASARLGLATTIAQIETASHWIGSIQGLDRGQVSELSPCLDAAALSRELQQTWQYFLSPRNLGGPGMVLESALEDLCYNLAEEDLVPCHRDFMARNFLVGSQPPLSLTLIDHQDLRLGPRYYDLASLLNDSLFAAPQLEGRLLERDASDQIDRTSYHRAVTQRTLKAIGTFCRFAQCGHPQHLTLVEPTLRRAWSQMGLVPELRHLPPLLEASWLPHLDAGAIPFRR